MLRVAAGFLCAIPLLAQALEQASTGDSAKGRKLYDGYCSVCHGLAGTGGRGPVLATAALPRAGTDRAMLAILRQGVGEMPAFGLLDPRDAKDIVAYVRTLSRVEPQPLSGDRDRGRQIFKNNNCGGCHIVNGDGSARGPELTGIGLRRSVTFLRESILKPQARIEPQWWIFIAVLPDGQRVRGRRVNEDSFTIQLEDAEGRLHSLRKSALQSLQYEPGVSLMPSYEPQLTSAQLDDLVAYLAALRDIR